MHLRDVCCKTHRKLKIVPMPFNLAVLDANGADGVEERFPTVWRWILMGHSLGDVTVPGITGDSDGVLDRRAAADNGGNLGEDARELVISGGNHAQFGSYGLQDGDGEASLSPDEQRALTADEIAGVFL